MEVNLNVAGNVAALPSFFCTGRVWKSLLRPTFGDIAAFTKAHRRGVRLNGQLTFYPLGKKIGFLRSRYFRPVDLQDSFSKPW